MPSRSTKTNVISISAYRNRDLVKTLENLLEQAKLGKINGLLYTARVGNSEHGVGACGTYADDPLGGLAAMTLAAETFKSQLNEQRFK